MTERLTFRLCLAALLAAGAAAAGCKGKARQGDTPATTPPSRAPPPPPADRDWTAEDIAQDPQAYMRWAEARIAAQVADREQRLRSLSARLTDIGLRQKNLTEKLAEVDNLNKRMKAAVQRADDEDRWPLKLGGQSFDQAKAKAVIEQTQKYLDERRGLTQAYEQAVARLDASARVLRKDIADLGALREKLALDLERVRLSQGMEELGQLRKTEAEIAAFAKTLGQMADESLSAGALPPEDREAARVDVDSFLK